MSPWVLCFGGAQFLDGLEDIEGDAFCFIHRSLLGDNAMLRVKGVFSRGMDAAGG